MIDLIRQAVLTGIIMIEREQIEMDVVFVGAGPANLAAALHLKSEIQRHDEFVEKGIKPGPAIGELAHLVRHPVGVGGDEGDAADQAHPDADDVDPVRCRYGPSGDPRTNA